MKRAFETAPNLLVPESSARPERFPLGRSLSQNDLEGSHQPPPPRNSLLKFAEAFADVSFVTDTSIYDIQEECGMDLADAETPEENLHHSSAVSARHLGGTAKTATTMFKTLVGPGLLFMPAGVRNAVRLIAIPLYRLL